MKEKTIWKPIAILLAVILCFSFHFALPVSADYENTHVNTGDQATDLVEVARTQVGYHEGTNNYTKYNVWFGSLNDYGYNYAWCQTFVAWCANQAGIPTSMIPRVSGTISGMDFFKKNETWKDAGITPKKGDIIYFHSKSSSGYHVGIVADVSGGQISTIEGNSSDRVAERSYSVGNSSIVGYGCPEYVRPNPPTYAKLSSDKQKYNLNEKITFSFDSDFATNYYFRICDDNGDVFAETMTANAYSTTLPAGKYSAAMSAFNDSGTAHSGWIFFEVVDTAPTYAKLSSDKQKYNLNEKITFSFDSDFATNYYFRICDDNGDVFAETMTANAYSTTLPAGKYSAAMSAFNDSGTAHSGWIFFEVIIPGDLNQDGTLSLTDLIPLQQSLLRQTTLTADEAQLADYNGDGNINVLDLMLLKRALLS